MPRYNHMCDVAFTLVTEQEDIINVPPAEILDALQKRVDYLRQNPAELAEAIGLCDSYIEEDKE